MNKPTQEEILAIAPKDGKMDVHTFNSIESFTIVYRYKYQAQRAVSTINEKFGVWVYASMHDMWKNPHVSVGYRGAELSKCEACGWMDGMHSQYCKRSKQNA